MINEEPDRQVSVCRSCVCVVLVGVRRVRVVRVGVWGLCTRGVGGMTASAQDPLSVIEARATITMSIRPVERRTRTPRLDQAHKAEHLSCVLYQ